MWDRRFRLSIVVCFLSISTDGINNWILSLRIFNRPPAELSDRAFFHAVGTNKECFL
jgi:hypothetical protein